MSNGREPKAQIFRRESTGLVREMNAFDVAWWGIAGTGGLYLLFYFMPYAQYYLPGSNLALSIALCLLVMLPLYALYASLASAMPRAGGDYVYQSRILHPAIGFAFPFSWFTVVWVCVFVAFGGYVVAALGLTPIFLLLGSLYSNSQMVALASYLQSSSGTFLVSVVVAVLSLVITVYPMKWWVLAQRFVLFPFTLISNFVIIYLFASSNSFYFHKMFDFWSNRMGYPDLYERIVQSTTSIGYTVPSFSLRHTILLMAVLSIYLAWTMWSAQGLMGEVKRANDMGRLFKSFLGAGLYLQWIGLFTPILLFQRVVGWDFMNRLAYAYYLPQSVVPFYPTVSLLASMLTTNPVLITLSTLGIVAGGLFIAASEFVIVTRIWLAMSLDRTLPSWFGNVNPRTHTPVGPVILSMVISVVAAYLFDYWPPFYSVITVGSVMGPAAVVFVTSIAAILFPKRRREIYEQAPVARYKPLGIPLIVLIGLASALASFSVDAMYLGAPELGYNAPVPVAFTFGILLLGFLLYYVNYAYQKAKGVDITIAFKQLPPD